MSLKLKTKSVRFEFVDDDVESVVTLSSEDDEATLVRKLRRVIALVGGGEADVYDKRLMAPMGAEAAQALKGRLESGDAAQRVVPANGWAAAYGPPALPDRLKGEVELIPPGEDA